MDTKERARIESAGGFVEFNRFPSPVLFSQLDFLFNQSQREFGIVARNGGLRVQDERQAEPGILMGLINDHPCN